MFESLFAEHVYQQSYKRDPAAHSEWLLKTANISSWVNSHPLTPPPPTPDASIHIKVWDAITYPFSNFNRCTVEIMGMDI